MTALNPFVLPSTEYKRDLNLVKAYILQNATYLHKHTQEPFEDCVAFVKKAIGPGGVLALKNPRVLTLQQVTPGNREKVETTFLDYLNTVVESDRILSPSMVCYERPEVVKSLSALYVERGIAGRKKAKGEMFQAQLAGDKVLENIKNAEQNARKIGINTISGMHGFTGNILYVKSGHSSLTSMCRTATGYGNASNEKLLCGSRHYWSSDIVIANILTIIGNTDYARLAQVVDAYQLHIPSVQEVMEVIEYSTRLYWRHSDELARIHALVATLDPLERVTFVYTGDFYHLMVYNEPLVRAFMDRLVKTPIPYIEDPEAVLKQLDDDLKALVNLMGAALLKGRDQSKLKEQDFEGYRSLAGIAVSVGTGIQEYADLIQALLVPKTLPPTVARIKSIVRRSVLASDTDSTIFTTQNWVQWYTGSYARCQEGDAVWYIMTYMATQVIIHVLAQFSANMGVSRKDLHRLSMKNEYAFPAFALTGRAKHYFAFMSAREGNVYEKYKSEIKGVALRSSLVPKFVIEASQALMLDILRAADEGRQFEARELYQIVYEHEQDIATSIGRGESKYLKTAQIKEKYKNMERSPYQHYEIWEEVFAPKYGNCPPPPYTAIKVPLDIANKTDMAQWLSSIEDRDLAKRLAQAILKRGRDKLTVLQLPTAVLSNKGVPPEILQAVNIRKLTYEILESFYMTLEVTGLYQVHRNRQRLVSDFYAPPVPQVAA